MQRETVRLAYLDGLRGVAIIGVLLYHYLGPSLDPRPNGDQFAHLPWNRYGWVGIELFFMVSGFVILMTLERCSGLGQFIWKRWLRLFPAMLVGSLLTLVFVSVFAVGPAAGREAKDLIPGLLFINPALLELASPFEFQSMDGVYWTLYVEVAFYIVFGTLYFSAGKSWAITGLVFIFAGAQLVSHAVAGSTGLIFKLGDALRWLGFVHFGWFAAGTLFYEYVRSEREPVFVTAVIVAVSAALTTWVSGEYLANRIALMFAVTVFAATVYFPAAQRLASNRVLTFAGFISYPLYLIHSSIGVGLIDLLSSSVSSTPPLLMVAIASLFVTAISWLIATHFEPNFRRVLTAPSTRAKTPRSLRRGGDKVVSIMRSDGSRPD